MSADLIIADAAVIATVDADRREIRDGWISVENGVITAIGGPGNHRPDGARVVSARGCLVTPGLINTHHHLYQNLTRAYWPMTSAPLFGWLQTLYPLWRQLDEEAAYVSAWVGLAELALSGCTTSTDHLYIHPAGGGDLITAEIEAARDIGVRFHPTHGSMSLSKKDGGLPPDDVVMDEDEILAESERLVAAHHDPSHGSMTRVALAPCSPFSRQPRSDAQDRRTRRTPQRAAAHPPRGERGGRRVLDGDVRAALHRSVRRCRMVHRPQLGRTIACGRTPTRSTASAGQESGSPTARARTSSSAPESLRSSIFEPPVHPSESAATDHRRRTPLHCGRRAGWRCCSGS